MTGLSLCQRVAGCLYSRRVSVDCCMWTLKRRPCQLLKGPSAPLHLTPETGCAQQHRDLKPLHSPSNWSSPSFVLLPFLPVVIPSFEVVAAAFVPFARYSVLQVWDSPRDRGFSWDENLTLCLIRNLEQPTWWYSSAPRRSSSDFGVN